VINLHIELLIKEIRKQKNMTLDELSKCSGVSKTHINDIENNIKEPTLTIAISIAKALNVQLTDLFKVIN
jgi:DNA-binding XRE family transcriptional regulator